MQPDPLGFQKSPKSEQTRIVAKLEELLSDLEAGVAELKAAQAKLVRYRQSLLKAAVDGTLTADWRARHTPAETGAQLLARILTERRARWEDKQRARFAAQDKTPPKNWQAKYPEPVAPDTTDLPALPAGWVWASLDQLAEFITSGSRGWAAYYSSDGATFIRSQNISKDVLDLSDIAFVRPPGSSEGVRTRVQKGDVLLTITGANVGKAAQVDVELEEAYVSQHVALIRAIDRGLSEYLQSFLTASCGGRGQLDRVAYGAGKPGLNLQQVAAVHVPLPPPQEISTLLEILAMQLEAIEHQQQSTVELQRQSTVQRKNLLKAAFSGQLVPQDPADEPASVLLERIRLERATQSPMKRPNGRKAKGVARA
jgi:type I restriction enzyme S subunit